VWFTDLVKKKYGLPDLKRPLATETETQWNFGLDHMSVILLLMSHLGLELLLNINCTFFSPFIKIYYYF